MTYHSRTIRLHCSLVAARPAPAPTRIAQICHVFRSQNPDLWVRRSGGIFRGNWTHSSFAKAGLRSEKHVYPSTIYQLSNEHHIHVEVCSFTTRKTGRSTLCKPKEENPAGADAVALRYKTRNISSSLTPICIAVSRNVLPKTYCCHRSQLK